MKLLYWLLNNVVFIYLFILIEMKRAVLKYLHCTVISKAVASIVNPVNKLYSLAVLQRSTDLSRSSKTKKHELRVEHDTCLLLKSHYIYRNVLYLVKMRNLSRNSSVRE